MCHVVQRDSPAIKFDRVEIAFVLAFFYWLKPLTDEGGEETGVPEKTPDDRPQKILATMYNTRNNEQYLQPHIIPSAVEDARNNTRDNTQYRCSEYNHESAQYPQWCIILTDSMRYSQLCIVSTTTHTIPTTIHTVHINVNCPLQCGMSKLVYYTHISVWSPWLLAIPYPQQNTMLTKVYNARNSVRCPLQRTTPTTVSSVQYDVHFFVHPLQVVALHLLILFLSIP